MTSHLNPAHELARQAASVADARKGTDTLILDVGRVLAITEAFVITSASNRRQVRSMADAIEEELKVLHDRAPLRVEGMADQQWVLLDYGDICVHVFLDETRAFYEIERLYRDVPTISWEPAVPVPDTAPVVTSA